jgi:hypothetical protein
MYGIMTQDGNKVLCHGTGFNSYILKRWDRHGNLVMRESALEVDQLMQDFMVTANRFDLSVFTFTEEQEQNLIVRKLRGY